ncbi:hypothetical protein RDWZM_003567 [Blomia tropicalis]|uniref:Uncharacterized protein n=1 Tax=Blomia tropicalis TaxID=40697 RepID=A0A9Q0MG19_BLOTA|nr:hypothetical protein RDWZM_003567 [Blomia tropicalis]
MFSRSLFHRLHNHCTQSICRVKYNSTVPSITTLNESFVRSTKVNVCGRFANRFTFLRPWFLRYIPKGGHPINIEYIDTMPNVPEDDDSIKTILILHGTPGSYYDYFKLLATFGNSHRIIIPNFPNFSYTMEKGCFWHSAEEKSEFIADFLRHINVKTIDCLMAHSMAAYTASYLWIYGNWANYFRLGSICLLNPVGLFKHRRKARLRLSLLVNICRLFALQQWIPMKQLLLPSSPKFGGSTLYNNWEISAWNALTLKLSNFENYHLRLSVLEHNKIPTLFIFSSNDRLYPSHVFYDQLFYLKVDYDDFDIYEQYENELIHASTDQSWIKVVDFRSAGHHIFNTHPDIVHSYIAELLDRSKVVERLEANG